VLLLVAAAAATTTATAAAAAVAATLAALALALAAPRGCEDEGVEWQEGEVQATVVEAARAELEATLLSLARRSSFRRSMFTAEVKDGSGLVLAMKSAVLERRGLRPFSRVSTS